MFNRYFEVSENNTDFLFANIAVKNIYFALISLDYILNYPNFEIGIYHDEHTYYFFHIQSLLTACGNISNVFYNYGGYSGRQATIRCEHLRTILKIKRAEFPLVFQKEVRNTNEHIDERYEQFHGLIGDYNLIADTTDPDMRETIQTNPHLRMYDKETCIYHTYGRNMNRIEYNLHDLYMELQDMLIRITENEVFESGWVDSIPNETVE